MANAKKILITTESHELLVVRRRGSTHPRHICPICTTPGCGLTLDEARDYTCLSGLELIREIEIGAVHAYEIAGGPLLICQKSVDTFCTEKK